MCECVCERECVYLLLVLFFLRTQTDTLTPHTWTAHPLPSPVHLFCYHCPSPSLTHSAALLSFTVHCPPVFTSFLPCLRSQGSLQNSFGYILNFLYSYSPTKKPCSDSTLSLSLTCTLSENIARKTTHQALVPGISLHFYHKPQSCLQYCLSYYVSTANSWLPSKMTILYLLLLQHHTPSNVVDGMYVLPLKSTY